MLRNLSLGFTAGGVGGAVNALFLYFAFSMGLAAAMGIADPGFQYPAFLYKQVVWGGIWGMMFALPFITGSWIFRGLLVGLLASLVTLFYVLPNIPNGPGMAGLGLGQMMPVLVLIANSIWGLVAVKWYDSTH